MHKRPHSTQYYYSKSDRAWRLSCHRHPTFAVLDAPHGHNNLSSVKHNTVFKLRYWPWCISRALATVSVIIIVTHVRDTASLAAGHGRSVGTGGGNHSPLVMSCVPHFLHKVNLYFFETPISVLKVHSQKNTLIQMSQISHFTRAPVIILTNTDKFSSGCGM